MWSIPITPTVFFIIHAQWGLLNQCEKDSIEEHTALQVLTAKWKEAGMSSRQRQLLNTSSSSTCKISVPKIWHVNTIYHSYITGINEWNNSGPFPHFIGDSDPWFMCKIHYAELNHHWREQKTPVSGMTASRSHKQLPFTALCSGQIESLALKTAHSKALIAAI